MSYDLDETFGCHLGTGRKDKDGYCYHGNSRAHIVAWERVNGPVPDGLVLDHLCARRHCIALSHLEAVTQSENLKRRSWKHKTSRKSCPKGHDWKVNMVIVPPRGVVCRQCNVDARGA
jgi:hypothetical protein